MGERQGTGESIGGDVKTAHQLELALTQPRSERALSCMSYLTVYIQ
jgi:hypothetical protein